VTRGALTLLLGLAWVSAAAAQTPTAMPVRVTYLTGATAYIDAGRNDGLAEGDTLHATRDGGPIATLRVSYLASRQASCEILSQSVPLLVGDTVDLIRRPADTPLAADTVAAPRPLAQQGSGFGLRGRIGARYLGVWERGGSGTHFTQPSLDLRLEGDHLGGSPIGVALDFRTQRTASALPDGTSLADGRTRVYRAALALAPMGSPIRVTAGRQYSTAISSVSLFDGAQAELLQPSWSVGIFAGSEPEPVELGYSTGVRDYGAYLQLHNRPTGDRYWSLTAGGVGSYTEGVTNREFLFVQGGFASDRLALFLTQEMDRYTAWKQAMGEPPWSLTSTFGSLRYDLTRTVSLNAGYDNRRSVRLYRDAVTPETAFDDAFRQGVWGGLGFRFRRGRLGIDARSSTGGESGGTHSVTLSGALARIAWLDAGLRSRTTRYDGPRESGWLEAIDLDLTPAPAVQLTLNGGIRLARDPMAVPTDQTISWVGADADVNLGRRWYLSLSGLHQSGVLQANDQVFGGLSYRF
jgi:hypothetical protein